MFVYDRTSKSELAPKMFTQIRGNNLQFYSIGSVARIPSKAVVCLATGTKAANPREEVATGTKGMTQQLEGYLVLQPPQVRAGPRPSQLFSGDKKFLQL